jgi:hypothetical protein
MIKQINRKREKLFVSILNTWYALRLLKSDVIEAVRHFDLKVSDRR